jgi:hypothetical protein
MERSFEFSIVRVCPEPARGEVINIGICVYLDTRLDIRILPSLRKVQALYGDIDLELLYDIPTRLNTWVDGVEGSLRFDVIRQFGAIELSDPGALITSDETYEADISRLMAKLVLPRTPTRAYFSEQRLSAQVRRILKREKILGEGQSDIQRHLVVPRFPISEEKELYVDFAVRNGRLHVTETIDFRVKTGISGVKKKEAGLVAITLNEAKATFGPETKRFVVYSGPSSEDDRSISSHLAILGSYADQILNFDSAVDRDFYLREMQAAARPGLLDRPN